MKHVEKQNLRRVRLFLLMATLLAVCFALSGCDEEGECIEGGEHDYVLVRENAWLLVIDKDETVEPGDQFEPRCGDTGRYFDEYVCTKCGLYLGRANGKTGVKQHELEPWKQTKAATCTSAGVEKRKCSNFFYRTGDNFVCNYSETRTVPALGHDYRDVEAKEPTCTEPGNTKGKKCSRCGHFHSGKVIPALGHDLVQHGAQAVTCTTVGWDAYVTCSRCNYTTFAEKAALGHDWGDAAYTWSADHGKCTARHECRRCKYYEDVIAYAMAADIPATCTENAKTVYTATFGDPFATQTVTVTAEGTAAGHDWGDATYTWSADHGKCTAKHECRRCKYYEDVTASATAADIPATCTEDAKTVYTATFGDPLATQAVTVTTQGTAGHDWDEAAYTWSDDRGTCTASRVCKRDGNHVETETVDSTVEMSSAPCAGNYTAVYTAVFSNPGFQTQQTSIECERQPHTPESIPDVPGTCKTPGLTGGTRCAICKIILEQPTQSQTNPDNHEGPFVLGLNADVPSTCKTPGYHTEGICKACGVEVKTELPLDSDNHVVVVVNAVPATCTQTGLTEGTKCAACGKVLSGLAETPIDPDNHDWNEASYSWRDDGFCIADRKCKLGGKHVQIITLPINVLSNTATCEQAGTVTYVADFDEPFAPQTKTSDAPALGHDWGDWTQTKAPNCTESGEKTHTCQRAGCGATETEAISAVPGAHVAADPVQENAVAGTCQAEGSYDSVTYCAKCGTELSRETINTGKDASNHAGGTYSKYVDKFVGEGKVAYYTFCSGCNAKFGGEGTADASEAPDDPDAWYKEDDNDGGEGGGSDGISGEG